MQAHGETYAMNHHMLGATLQHLAASPLAAHDESHMTGGMLGATLQHLLAAPVSEMAAHGESHMTGGMLGAMAPKMILLI